VAATEVRLGRAGRRRVGARHQAGLDAGINWIDTAAIYGHGHLRGAGRQAIAGRRDDVIVATKCGARGEGDSREIGKSLRRERARRVRRQPAPPEDRRDRSLQIHWPEPGRAGREGWAPSAS
jgi:aryl-alcohol dehydrogenase-like predicted oxidoreductase